ncbi:MAG: LPP20 family lipoprotein [Deltaproteobacteria bacterium]|nr:LPP20 family lipoprotein [Deltaproteobacteria bacterium]
MKSKLLVIAGITVGLCILTCSYVFGQDKVGAAEWTQIVEKIGDKGKINWSEGYIEAVGIGAPPERFYGKAQARPMALRAATLDAYRNLLEATKGVRVDSTTTVRDFAVESDVINSQVDGLVKGAKEVHKEYLSDGTVEVTIRMPLAGGFAQVIIPKPMQKKPADTPPPAAPAPATPAPAAPAPAVTAPAPVVYTGMVVDARGLQARPAMAPKIIDENGKEVYGSMNVDREYAVQQGVSGYARDLTAAQSNARVTNNPVSLKGLKTEGPGRSDIVISNADAELIRSSEGNVAFLKKCRVMIVLD